MSDREAEANRAVAYLADKYLDGKKVISIGLKNVGDEYIIGMTVKAPLKVKLPLLPGEYGSFAIEVNIVNDVARAH